MTLAITAAVAGGGYPRAVQVSVTGLTVGAAFEVTGLTAAGWTWLVRGGNGQLASATTAVLADISTPLGVAIQYEVRQVGASPAVASLVTVPYTGRYVLQSVDGRTTVPFVWVDKDDPREIGLRAVTFDVPGRTSPVTRWDVSGGESFEIPARMDQAGSEALRTQLRTASPVMVLRTDGGVRDVDPVQYVILTKATRSLVGAANGYGTDRVWSLACTQIADPEPSVVLAASNGDDFDTAYAALTGTDFDTEWSTLTWVDFDATDWATH